jgi:hypothetical protein
MNIFYLDSNAAICAQYHCDKHVVKMILEYAQLLSTAHRVIDGKQYTENNKGRMTKRWKLNDGREDILYKATHINHPSAVWARQGKANYSWLYALWISCLNEYTHRYGKSHACEKLRFVLDNLPKKIKDANWNDPPQAMPDDCKTNDTVSAYRQYYVMKKNGFARWTNREIPKWYSHGILSLLTIESQAMGLYD